MKNLLKAVTTFFLLIALVPAALAVTVQEAKQQGLIGEGRDGYLGLVTGSAPAEVVELVNQVNQQRRQRYQEIARENNISMTQVVALAYERAVQETQPGHYIQLPGGQWVQK